MGLLVRPRTAPVPVVPAPPDGSGDELRHPANGRAAGAVGIWRPHQTLTRYLDPGPRISQPLASGA